MCIHTFLTCILAILSLLILRRLAFKIKRELLRITNATSCMLRLSERFGAKFGSEYLAWRLLRSYCQFFFDEHVARGSWVLYERRGRAFRKFSCEETTSQVHAPRLIGWSSVTLVSLKFWFQPVELVAGKKVAVRLMDWDQKLDDDDVIDGISVIVAGNARPNIQSP